MATPKEQHDVRSRAIVGSRFEQRREREMARARSAAEHADPVPARLDDPCPEESAPERPNSIH